MSTQAEKSPAQSAIDWVVGMMNSHLLNVSRNWVNRLYFNESGLLRLAATVGWIEATRQFDESLARALAEGLCHKLDYLANYGGEIEVGGIKFPAFRVMLVDDASLHGFGLAWYVADLSPDKCESRLTLERWKDGTGVLCRYRYYRNGALIYRGPTASEPDRTREPRDLWTSHT